MYFAVINGTYLFLIGISGQSRQPKYRRIRAATEYEAAFKTPFYKPVSVIVPAHNEQSTIADTVSSILAVRYPELEVVVVNDGSTDGTLEVLRETFALVEAGESPSRSSPARGFVPSTNRASFQPFG